MPIDSKCSRGLILSLCLLGGAPAADPEGPRFEPKPEQAQVLKQALGLLQGYHYREVSIDDSFSSVLLDRFLDALDPRRDTFLRSDIEEFQARFGTRFDDALRSVDLAPAFEMYERFYLRRGEFVAYMQRALDEQLDELEFESDEALQLDRGDAPWPSDESARDELWRKRFKNDVLGQRLDDRDDEEVRKTLSARYRTQRKRLDNMDGADVFSYFLNVLSATYDPHTTYFPPLDAENFDMRMSLSLEGIGALLRPGEDYVYVERLVAGGPAELGGELRPGDEILEIRQGDDGQSVDVTGWDIDDVIKKIRGPRDSVVVMVVRNEAEPKRTVRIVRDEVQLEDQAATSEMLEFEHEGAMRKVGVVHLPTFYMDFEAARKGDPDFRSSSRDVEAELEKLVADGAEGVVLDLRYNGGGSLLEAQRLSGLFLGRRPVVQVREETGDVRVLTTGADAVYDGPLVVMVNRLSASASEIVAAAIQDYGRGVVVGQDTFGKGTVQSIERLSSGQLKLTGAAFYRVNGDSTQHRGVEVDVEFPPLYDPESVGESALEGALPFDRVEPVKLRGKRIRKVEGVAALAERHAKRRQEEPDLAGLVDRLELIAEARAREELSLVETTRRATSKREREALVAIEVARRAALGLEELEDPDSWDPYATQDDAPDVLLYEAARVLADAAVRSRTRFIGFDAGREVDESGIPAGRQNR